jgi:hypothetical protein
MSAVPAQVATPFWQSKTFYGIVLTFALPIVKKYVHFTNVDTDSLAEILADLGAGVSAAWALYGRAKAQGPMTISAKPLTPTE